MDCYVYLHRRKTDVRIFYIGKGRGKRAWKKTARSDWWKRVEAKHGRDVDIVLRGLTDEQAFELERDLIAWIGLDNLCNLRDGGEGGYAMKPEVRQKMSERHKGRMVSQATREKMRALATGRTHTDETKALLREYRMKQVMPPKTPEERKNISERMKGRLVSEDTKKRISEAKKGKKTGIPMPDHLKAILVQKNKERVYTEEMRRGISERNSKYRHTPEAKAKLKESNARLNKERRKPIRCSNGMVFEFSGDAERWLRENGFPSAGKSNIVSCCTGNLKSAYGFTWAYENQANEV